MVNPQIVRAEPIPVSAQSELDLQERSVDHSLALSVASALICPANKARTGLFIVNDSAIVVYISLGRAAAVNAGIRLNATGGSLEINKANLWRGDVYAIAVSGTPNLTVQEIETRYAY